MSSNNQATDNRLSSNAIEIAIRLILILLIVTLCFQIIKPFIIPVIWGAIIAVAFFPLYQQLNNLLGNRNKLTAIPKRNQDAELNT
jgi:predicted PurR-regulated permease PerM